MAEPYKDPWTDAANQAVGALYKYYLTKPTAADMAAAELEAQTKQQKLQELQNSNRMNQRLYDMGGWSGAPASVQENLYTNSLGAGSDAAKRFEDVYVTKPAWQDFGDKKALMGVNGPMQAFTVGAPPRFEMDKENQQAIPVPAIASRESAIASAMMPYLVAQESGGNPNAVSPKGAGGLTQIMPDTARDPGFGVQPLRGWDGRNPATAPVEEQLRFGQDYLAAMIDNRGGNVAEGLAAYNAGPGAVQQHGGIPPYQETQNYVQNIMGNAGVPGTVDPNNMQVINYGTPQAEQDRKNLKEGRINTVTKNSNTSLLEIFPLLAESGLPATGRGGQIVRGMPLLAAGTNVAAIDRRLNQIKASESIGQLQQMREENKTGGAVGNVSNEEHKILQDAREAIDTATSEADFILALMRYYNLRNDVIFRPDANSLPNENHPGHLPTPEAVQQMTTREELLNAITPFGENVPDFVRELVVNRMNELGL